MQARYQPWYLRNPTLEMGGILKKSKNYSDHRRMEGSNKASYLKFFGQ